MTLSVYGIYFDDDGEQQTTISPRINGELAGSEAWRYTVWGSQCFIRRGAVFLPSLREMDLLVTQEQLPAFIEEVRFLLAEVDAIAEELTRCPERLTLRLQNFLDTAEQVAGLKDGILYIG